MHEHHDTNASQHCSNADKKVGARPALDPEAIRAVVLAYFAAPNPDDPEDTYGAETSWRVEVEIVPAEVDEDTGEEWAPESAIVTAYDLGHHSNVLSVEMSEDGSEVLRVE